jgi:SAM-dependent methyltransferase
MCVGSDLSGGVLVCDAAIVSLGETLISSKDVKNKRVIEVGALDVNGSLRGVIEKLGPADYVGVDITPGPGVDEICDVGDLVSRYGNGVFDLVICTEVLEHVRDWRTAISNLKNLVKPQGVLFFSTRSIGFPYHGYPHDFWRYEMDDLRALFSDYRLLELRGDPIAPGVILKATRPDDFSERDLRDYELYSIVAGKRCRDVHFAEVARFKVVRLLGLCASRVLPLRVRTAINRMLPGANTRFVGYN